MPEEQTLKPYTVEIRVDIMAADGDHAREQAAQLSSSVGGYASTISD